MEEEDEEVRLGGGGRTICKASLAPVRHLDFFQEQREATERWEAM